MPPETIGPSLRGVPVHSSGPRVSVVIPTFNEAKNLPHVFSQLPDDVHEVIVVDGRSVDGTVEVARALRPDVRIVRQNRCGKGNALACGFRVVTGDIIVMLDADCSADPREIPLYIAALLAGADFAKGTRFAEGGGSADITGVRAWGNRWLNRAVNVLYGTRYTDLCYGYNAFWTHCLPALELDAGDGGEAGRRWGDGFEIETLINTRVAKARLVSVEVPSYESRRLHGRSNLRTWRDGARVLRALLIERLNRRGTRHVVSRTWAGGLDISPPPRPPADLFQGPDPAHQVTDVQKLNEPTRVPEPVAEDRQPA
jgi:glycosyltransferase involved in cell wall biosynthesis